MNESNSGKDTEKKTIVVKRIKKVAGGHHGGAWKIAYADFVTAMMAFFLLMWLLGSTTQGDLQGIADYFSTPLHVAMSGGSGAGASDSVVQGGGRDLTRSTGQVQSTGSIPTKKKPKNKKSRDNTEDTEKLKRELQELKDLKSRILEAIEVNPHLKNYKDQLLLDLVTDGLSIQIVDEKNRPMFAVAKADLEPHAKVILKDLGAMLNSVPNKINISGHTDARNYMTGDKYYSNWELSADRANSARRELLLGGMDEGKVMQVVGLSSAILFDKTDPLNPTNRRIAITVLNRQAEDRIMGNYVLKEINTAQQFMDIKELAPAEKSNTEN